MEKMGGDPASCCKAIQRDKTVWICPMEGGPEDMTIYGLTKRIGWMIRSEDFFSVVREESADDAMG